MAKFKKGESGNPKGRPKDDPELIKLFEGELDATIERVKFWRDSTNPKASIAACNIILDRALGKPRQAVDLNHSGEITVIINRKPRAT